MGPDVLVTALAGISEGRSLSRLHSVGFLSCIAVGSRARRSPGPGILGLWDLDSGSQVSDKLRAG